jgi:homoserine dehydrogenase
MMHGRQAVVMKDIKIGLLGFGTVGAGVVHGLRKNGDLLAARLGVRPVIARIADLDLESDRGVTIDRAMLTSDAFDVVHDPDVDVIVELIGGTGVAREVVLAALKSGKPVVTANKALLAEHGEAVFGAAREHGVDIYFGAAVGGGIPIIRALREGLTANRVESIFGILNGTCNYILTRMEHEGLSFDDALQAAQEAGYAEADPALDVDGFDTAHKAAILAALAYGSAVPLEAVHVEGIRGLSEIDIEYAFDLGYRVKLLAVIKSDGSSCEVRVQPALVSLDHMLASVSGVFNAVMVRGDLSGDTLYYGRGAGREPTASTVIGDIADVVRNVAARCPGRLPPVPPGVAPVAIKPMDAVETRYYLRLSLLDKPGVLARITSTFGSRGISIASVLQQEEGAGDYVPVVIVTHRALEREVNAALAEIDGMDIVDAPTIRLRIEA